MVVAVTDGEASHGHFHSSERAKLAFVRQAESTVGLHRIGVSPRSVIRLGLPDGKITQHETALYERLSRLVGPKDAVITTWEFDGHPDHEACGRVCKAICTTREADLLEAPVWMWHWAVPGDPRVDWYRLRTISIDSQSLLKKLYALEAHRSQLTSRSSALAAVLDEAIVERAGWNAEYFFVKP